ncbi:MAG: lactonase family protein [Pirellulaceae bacterium]|nr:lactonase family protein [Pirellulaceae bacterium]
MNNRHLMLASWLAAGIVSLMVGCAADSKAAPKPAEKEVKLNQTPGRYRVYLGTYTGPKSKGIQLYDFDAATGALTPAGLAAETANPSFLAISPDNKYLYAAGEVDDFGGKPSGAVVAFSVDAATGKLTELNAQPSGGGGPCHVSVDAFGKNAFVANYGGGSVSSYPVGDDGKIGEPASFVQHSDKESAGAKKQPHGHWIGVDPSGKYALACDLGLDQVLIYRLDSATGKLSPNDPPAGQTPPGAGPRHAAFSADGKRLYVINELDSTLTVFDWDSSKGSLAEIQTVPTLPADYKEPGNSTAEIFVHPSGKFVYGSNRGHDSIAAYAIDASTGKLTLVGHTPTGGKHPRNFAIDPTGQWIIAANMNSDTLFVFKIDADTGKLTQVGDSVAAPTPTCVVFAPGK